MKRPEQPLSLQFINLFHELLHGKGCPLFQKNVGDGPGIGRACCVDLDDGGPPLFCQPGNQVGRCHLACGADKNEAVCPFTLFERA